MAKQGNKAGQAIGEAQVFCMACQARLWPGQGTTYLPRGGNFMDIEIYCEDCAKVLNDLQAKDENK